ncbi:hypothetical protein H712_02378 [Brucella ovis IntaBari-2009-88-4]|nr:hypothetical protein H712_02378 [Brucella ovis IntaBari-2009-88-4]
MSDANILKLQDEAGVLEMVQAALASSTPLEIIGHGSKRGIGRPVEAGHVLDVSGLSGVTLYEPDELVLSARAGTPMAEIQKLLADHNQCFHFEPMDYGPLLGAEPGRGTIGGTLAANLAGPRRLKAGAARDHVLGVRVVSGRGEVFKSGGRVVKNVTGYDLSKGMANSWGTLGVATEVTFKVLPAPETVATLAVRGLDDEQAARVMALAMGSREEVSSAAHLPPTVAWRFLDGKLGGDAATILRLEGFAPSVAHRSRQLQDLLGRTGTIDVLDDSQSRQLWREVRDVLPYAQAGDGRAVWRVSMAPGGRVSPPCWRGCLLRLAGRAHLDAHGSGTGSRCSAQAHCPAWWWSCNADLCAGTGARERGCIPAATGGACRPFRPFETAVRPGEYSQSGAHVSPSGWSLKPCRPISALNNCAIPACLKPKRFCANVCIAVSAPRSARPM